MISVVMVVEDGSHLETWSGSFCQFVESGEEQSADRTCLAERFLVSAGGL